MLGDVWLQIFNSQPLIQKSNQLDIFSIVKTKNSQGFAFLGCFIWAAKTASTHTSTKSHMQVTNEMSSFSFLDYAVTMKVITYICAINEQNNESAYHITLFKGVPILKTHFYGQAGNLAEICDSEINSTLCSTQAPYILVMDRGCDVYNSV